MAAGASAERRQPISQKSKGAPHLRLNRLDRDVLDFRDLCVCKVVIPAHTEDEAALFGETLDGQMDRVRHLAFSSLILRGAGRWCPGSGLLCIPAFHLGMSQTLQRLVPGCGVQVGLDVQGGIKLCPVPPDSQKDILHDVLRHGCVPHVPTGEAEQRSAVPVEKLPERVLIAFADFPDPR